MKSNTTFFSHAFFRLCFLLACAGAPLASFAQGLTAQVEDVGGYYRLTFKVASKDVSGFTPPSLADFEVLSGPSTSTSSSYEFVNGRASHSESTTFTYILSAKRGGRVTIGAASVKVGGRVLRSRPVSLNAQSGGTAAGAGQGIARRQQPGGGVQQRGSAVTQRDLFIDMTPSRTRVREQEAVLLTYRVHVRAGVGLYNTELTHKPDFQGVLSQEIPLPGNQVQMAVEHRGGTAYRTGVILQYLVFPQRSGRIVIPSIKFNCTVVQQDNTLDLADAFFNGGGMTGVSVERSVPATAIQADALPQPRPAAFSGAVGKFSLQGKLLSAGIRTNDVATYRVTLSGLGNLKLITPPAIAFPKDFDTYDPKTDENTRVTANGVAGQLTFDYTFVPRNVGKYTLPAVEFVYFDTEADAYRTLAVPAQEINVGQGSKTNADVDRQLAMLRSDIRALHPCAADGTPARAALQWGSLSYWALTLLFAAMAAAAAFVARKRRKGRGDLAGRRRGRAARNALAAVEAARRECGRDGGGEARFRAALYRALCSFACDVFGIARADLNASRLPALLAEKGVGEALAADFASSLEALERAQYAPGGAAEREGLYAQVCRLIEQTAAWQKTQGRRRGKGAQGSRGKHGAERM